MDYSDETKGYKLFDPIKMKMFLSKDVDFFEDCTKIQGKDIEKKRSCQESPIIHFLSKIATNDDKLVEREAIEGEDIINEGNHDDHNMIYGDDGENHSESSQSDGDNLDHEEAIGDDQDHEEVNGDIQDYEELNQVRRSKRVRQPPQRLLGSINFIYDNDLLILKDALSRDDSENLKEVVKLEYKSLVDMKAWRLVQLSVGKEAWDCKWIFKKKWVFKKKLRTNESLDK
jgi:hypothetical protein